MWCQGGFCLPLPFTHLVPSLSVQPLHELSFMCVSVIIIQAIGTTGRERMNKTQIDTDTILNATLTTLLRSTADFDSGDTLSVEYDPDNVADETRASLREEIEAFLEDNAEDLQAALDSRCGYTQTHIGEDIALTRNHHGAGFWDRGLDGVGTRLTEAAHSLGSFDLYATTDGVIRS